MTLSDAASIGSLVSGVAVLISLIYLALQVRQAEKNQRALMQQGRANRVADSTVRIAEAGLSSLWHRGMRGDESLTTDEIDQFLLMTRAGFISAEDSFLQHLAGQLDDAAFKSFETGARSLFMSPGLRAAWKLTSSHYGVGFVHFMDEAMKETALAPTHSIGARWLEMVRTEKTAA